MKFWIMLTSTFRIGEKMYLSDFVCGLIGQCQMKFTQNGAIKKTIQEMAVLRKCLADKEVNRGWIDQTRKDSMARVTLIITLCNCGSIKI